MHHRWVQSLIISLLLAFVFSFQNCSWSSSDSNFRGAQLKNQASLNGGDTYDGKPEADYVRRIPGYNCGGNATEYGSLNILGDSALLTISDGNECSQQKEISTSEIHQSPNTDAVLGYKEGIYTKSDSVLSTSSESFTEVWCQHKSEDRSQVFADIVVQWEQSGHTAKGYVFTDQGVPPVATELVRKIDIHQISYRSESLNLVIHRVSKVSGEEQYVGYYQDKDRFGETQLPVECRLGGQFDPAAPQIKYPQSSIIFEEGKPIDDFAPTTSHSGGTFQIEGKLPAGLTFDTDTGRISGTPVELQKRTPYQITMKFKFGEISTPLFIGSGRRVTVTTTDISDLGAPDEFACFDEGSDCSLSSALNWANTHPEKPLIIDLPTGSFDLSRQELVIKGSVTLNGTPLKTPTSFDAKGLSRLFRLEPGAFLELNQIHLYNGRTHEKGGAIMAEEASLVIKNSLFKDHAVVSTGEKAHGGAVYIDGGESLEIYESQFINNRIEANSNPIGGAVYSRQTQRVTIEGSEFRANYAPRGGALYFQSPWSGLISLERNQFIDNEAVAEGGALYVDNGHIYVDGSLFDNNTSFTGGGLYMNRPAAMKVTNSRFTRNTAQIGSVFYFDWPLQNGIGLIRKGVFFDNSLSSPTGLYNSEGKGTLLFLRTGGLFVQDSIFRDNELHQNCKVLFQGGVHGFGVKSLGGNIFEDSTCHPVEGDRLM